MKNKFFLKISCNGNTGYLYINGKKFCNFKSFDSIPPYFFSLGSVS